MKLRFFIFISFFLFLTSNLYAHKVIIFAWYEKGKVLSTSKFPGGRKVKQGRVSVYNKNDIKVLEGVTDDQGFFSFDLKKKEYLKLVLDAGVGHKAVWVLDFDEEDIGENTHEKSDEEKQITTLKDKSKETDGNKEASYITADQMERLLDAKIRPLILMIEDLEEKKRFSDILGGIGYIIGLLGLATYFKFRN